MLRANYLTEQFISITLNDVRYVEFELNFFNWPPRLLILLLYLNVRSHEDFLKYYLIFIHRFKEIIKYILMYSSSNVIKVIVCFNYDKLPPLSLTSCSVAPNIPTCKFFSIFIKYLYVNNSYSSQFIFCIPF